MLDLVRPALRLAARGPSFQPVVATNHDPGATWLELVARPLWGLAAHAAGGGQAPEAWADARCALTGAVDPDHPWFVGMAADRDQRLVEAATVGVALALAPHEMWEPLSGDQRQHLATWLSTAHRRATVANNWAFFPVLATMGLDRIDAGLTVSPPRSDSERSVAPGSDPGIVCAQLERIESYALDTEPGGWYADGPRRRSRDYYTPFAFHMYGLLHRSLAVVGRDEARNERIAGRAGAFAEQFQHWFADDGSAVPFGRSQGYRFAQGAFWGTLAFADLDALGWGRIRGLAERHLDWWWKQPVATDDGMLSVGYAYPNSSVVEAYVAAGSPYWATKLFIPLALSPNHPFWAVDAEPAGAQGAAVNPQPGPGVLLCRDPDGGVVLLNGQTARQKFRNAAAKYAKFAYSTRAGFSVPNGDPNLGDGAFDSVLAMRDDSGHWRTRSAIEEVDLDAEHDILFSKWRLWSDVSIATWLRPVGIGHVRVHRLRSGRRVESAEGGFAAPWSSREKSETIGDGDFAEGRAWVRGQRFDNSARWVHSLLIDVPVGDGIPLRAGQLERPHAGSNILFPRTSLPTLLATRDPGEHWLACAVAVLDREPSALEEGALTDAAAELLTSARY